MGLLSGLVFGLRGQDLGLGLDNKLSSRWKTIFKTVHLCCGYPDKLDTDEYLKAPKTNYNLLAPKIDSLGFDEVSIENAEANNDLSLLALFKKTKEKTFEVIELHADNNVLR